MNAPDSNVQSETMHRELFDAATTVHERLSWGASADVFAELVLCATPAEVGLVGLEVVAGPPAMHRSPVTVSAALPRLTPERSLVLHLAAVPMSDAHLQAYARALAAVASTGHVGCRFDGDEADSFADWLVQRNTMLEREVERMHDLARFLIETAKGQLGDG